MPPVRDLPNPLPFGLGCFAFEVARQDVARVYTFEGWRAGVEAALSRIPSVESVHVTYDPDEVVGDRWFVPPKAQRTVLPEVQEFEPDLCGARVAFEVSIPNRLHSELLGKGTSHACERFRVETLYEYHGPCTFVTCLDGIGTGSEAVRLLWNFLRREIPRASTEIEFTLLGPSPFHADFTLSATAAEAKSRDAGPLFTSEVLSRHGYADIALRYNSSDFGSIDDAYDKLKLVLADELSLYYQLVRYQNWVFLTSGYLTEKTAMLVGAHVNKGISGTLERLFKTGAAARRLGLEALQAKLELQSRAETGRAAITQVYAQSSIIGCLRESVDGMLPDTEAGAISNTLDVVAFAEGGRTKELEVAIVSASTFLGGLAGAAAALFAR